VIVASFGTEPLAQREDAPEGEDGPSIEEPRGATWTSSGETFAIGPKAGDGTARWIAADSPHLLVVGATGGGKGGLIRLIAREALEAGWVLRIVDPRRRATTAGLPSAALPWRTISRARWMCSGRPRPRCVRDVSFCGIRE
jgi:hypothetical protein